MSEPVGRTLRALLCVALLVTACQRESTTDASNADPVVARVGDRAITVSELRASMPPVPVGLKISPVEARRRTLEEVLVLELSERIAAERDLLRDPRFLARARAIDREARRQKQDALRRLLSEQLVREYRPDPEAIQRYYERSPGRFQTTRVHLREIVTATEAEAEEALLEIRGGAGFEDVARRRSRAPSARDGGRIGPYTPGEVPTHLAPHVLLLGEPGTTGGPVETPEGWTLVYLERRETGVPRELGVVRPAIERILQQREMRQRYERAIQEARAQMDVSINEAVLIDESYFPAY